MKKIFIQTGCLLLALPGMGQTSFQYDAAGNMVAITYNGHNPCNNSEGVCAGATVSFQSGITNANSYQWQVNTGSGFTAIYDNSVYKGTATPLLVLQNPPTAWYGYQYRCLAGTAAGQELSPVQLLKFIATWLGTASTAWENPLNWNCGRLPDANTDVVIKAGSSYLPVVNSLAACRGLRLEPATTCTVATGDLKITGKQ